MWGGGVQEGQGGLYFGKGGLSLGSPGRGSETAGITGWKGEEFGEAGGGWEVGLSVGPASVWLGQV